MYFALMAPWPFVVPISHHVCNISMSIIVLDFFKTLMDRYCHGNFDKVVDEFV